MSNPSSDSYRNPLRYQGQDYSFAPRFYRPRDPINPTSSPDIKPKENIGYYPLASFWSNSTNGNLWVLTGIVKNLANWVLIGKNTGSLLSLSDDTNTVVFPSSPSAIPPDNIRLTGHLNEQLGNFQTVTANAPSNIIKFNPMSSARWIVDPLSSTNFPNGTATTIGAAVSVARSGDTIFVMPGTYTENIVLPAGVSISAYPCDGYNNTILRGSITCSSSNSGNQNVISGIFFQTNGASFLNVTGTNQCLVKLVNCFLAANNAAGINLSNPNGSIWCQDCSGNVSASQPLFSVVSSQTQPQNFLGLVFTNCFIANSDSTIGVSTVAAGTVRIYNSSFFFPISSSSTGSVFMTDSTLDTSLLNTTALTIGGSGTNTVYNCGLYSGSGQAASISTTLTMTTTTINSSNAPALGGGGTLNYGGLVFSGSNSTNSVSTKNLLTVT